MADEFASDLLKVFNLGSDPATDDRVVAILFAAYAEQHFVKLIADKMPNLNPKYREKLFKPDGLIGTASAKIDIAFVLGIISSQMRDIAVAVSRVRNRFAHYIDVDSFDHASVAKLIDDIPVKTLKMFDGTAVTTNSTSPLILHADASKNVANRREKFCQCGVILCTNIMMDHREEGEYHYRVQPKPSPSK